MPTKTPNAWYGWVPDRPDQRDFRYAAIAAPPRRLPANVDLRATCSAIEDQGRLGSCTANALAGNLEFLERKAGHAAADLSRLFIYYNERVIEGTVASDAGAMLRDGIKSLVSVGVCPETTWPYRLSAFATKPPPAAYRQAATRKATSYHRIVGLTQMRQCLAEGFPFVFGFSVYESFESPGVAQTGTVSLPQPGERQMGGHAVCAVGYDDPTQRLLVRNSWGAAWGQGGYFTLPYAYVEAAGLAADFWTIRAFQNE